MKIRILSSTIPDWLAPHLTGHHVTTGPNAYQACRDELWPTYNGPLETKTPGRKKGSKNGEWTHGDVAYTNGRCRCDHCREDHRINEQRRVAVRRAS